MVIDYNTNETREGFISCGSTAGNYVGFRDGSSVTDETIDFSAQPALPVSHDAMK
jgi:hypothetical protein